MFLLLFFWILPFSRSLLSDNQKQQILDLHNEYRRKQAVEYTSGAQMKEMEWDDALATVAQNFANQGAFTGHNSHRRDQYKDLVGGNEYVGENWYSGPPLGGTGRMPEDTVHAWVDFSWPDDWNDPNSPGCSEREAYAGTCSGMDGHFTQVLWEKSYKVGCGYTDTHGTTCNYVPAGNFNNQAPFQTGQACSLCGNDATHKYCVNSLCSKTSSNNAPPTRSPTPSNNAPPTRSPTPPPTRSPTPSNNDPQTPCTFTYESVRNAERLVECSDGWVPDCISTCVSNGHWFVSDGITNPYLFNWIMSQPIEFNCPEYCCFAGQGDDTECTQNGKVEGFKNLGDPLDGKAWFRTSEAPVISEDPEPNSASNNHYYLSILSLSATVIYMLL